LKEITLLKQIVGEFSTDVNNVCVTKNVRVLAEITSSTLVFLEILVQEKLWKEEDC